MPPKLVGENRGHQSFHRVNAQPLKSGEIGAQAQHPAF